MAMMRSAMPKQLQGGKRKKMSEGSKADEAHDRSMKLSERSEKERMVDMGLASPRQARGTPSRKVRGR